MTDLITLGPECLSLKAVSQKNLKGSSVPFGLTTPKALSAPILVTASEHRPLGTPVQPHVPALRRCHASPKSACGVHLMRQMGHHLLLNSRELAWGGAEQALPCPRALWSWDMACSVLWTASCRRYCAKSWAASRLEALAVCCCSVSY